MAKTSLPEPEDNSKPEASHCSVVKQQCCCCSCHACHCQHVRYPIYYPYYYYYVWPTQPAIPPTVTYTPNTTVTTYPNTGGIIYG